MGSERWHGTQLIRFPMVAMGCLLLGLACLLVFRLSFRGLCICMKNGCLEGHEAHEDVPIQAVARHDAGNEIRFLAHVLGVSLVSL